MHMTQTLDLGPRVELISMDPHFHDITIALYSPGSDGQPAYLVHTYSSIPGADERLARLRQTMKTLGGIYDYTPEEVAAKGAERAGKLIAVRKALLGTG